MTQGGRLLQRASVDRTPVRVGQAAHCRQNHSSRLPVSRFLILGTRRAASSITSCISNILACARREAARSDHSHERPSCCLPGGATSPVLEAFLGSQAAP